jgi:hypothetical protein
LASALRSLVREAISRAMESMVAIVVGSDYLLVVVFNPLFFEKSTYAHY